MTTPEPPQLDLGAAATWIEILHGDARGGYIHVDSTDDWAGRTFPVGKTHLATEYIQHLDQRGKAGIYLRVTTLAAPLPAGSRGGDVDSHAIPGLWADIDILGPGHAEANLPPDEAAARSIITESGLPEPTLWIHSGGGLYPWWLLNAPHVITDDLKDIQTLSRRWQETIASSAKRLGWKYGPVGDLARVLRIPGTINRKEGLTRPCRILDDSATGAFYSLEDLRDVLATVTPDVPEPIRRLTVVPRTDGGTSPGDDFEQRTDWHDILTPHGWKYLREQGRTRYWQRPDKTGHECSATTGRDPARDRLFVFTTSTGFEALTSYTKFAAHAILNHGGDYKEAARALKAAGYGQDPPKPSAEPKPSPPPIPDDPFERPNLAVVDGTSARVLDEEPEPDMPTHAFGATEDGLAQAMVARYAHELRYCPQRGKWLHWTGYRWLWDDAEYHRELTRKLARDLPEDPFWRKFRDRALSATGVAAVVRLAQTDPRVVVNITDLDGSPYELNTPAGIIDLRTGQLRPPDPSALHTRCTAVAPDFDANPAVFTKFLTDTFGDDHELRGYVQRLLGISAIGAVLEQLFPFAHGPGANGKSTLLEACMHALGFGESGYAMAAPSEMLMARRHSEHPAELAQLAGARLVVCSELDDGQKFAEARVKQLTGRDSINARFMRRDPFTFTPSHTLWLLGNHKPAAHTGGPAFWRRIRLLPFGRIVPEDQRDPKLGEKLNEEAGAILAWIARGAADYHATGLQEPASVRVATDAYESDQDTVGRFMDECCHLAPGNTQVRVYRDVLREAYEKWCRENGDEPVNQKRFVAEIRDRAQDGGTAKVRGRRMFNGVALLMPAEDDDSQEGLE